MKKHLIAAAVAAAVAAPAMAQNVEIYGVLDQGWTDIETDTDRDRSNSTVNPQITEFRNDHSKLNTTGNGGAFTSQRLGFRGTEDLGGGMKANFTLEFGLGDSDGDRANSFAISNDTANPTTVRQAWVGLSGSMGSIRAGRMVNFVDGAWAAGSVGSQNNFLGSAYNQRETNARSDRLIEYVTPAFSGFTAGVQYGTRDETSKRESGTTTPTTNAEVKFSDEVSEMGLTLRYANGPLNVNWGYQQLEGKRESIGRTTTVGAVFSAAQITELGLDEDDEIAVDNLDNKLERNNWVLGASYNLGPVTLFGLYNDLEFSNKNRLDNEKTSHNGTMYEIGARVPIGAFTLSASFFDGNIKRKQPGELENSEAKTKTGFDGYQLIALYSLSKRTTMYGVYGSVSTDRKFSDPRTVDNTRTDKFNVEVENYGFGIRHTF